MHYGHRNSLSQRHVLTTCLNCHDLRLAMQHTTAESRALWNPSSFCPNINTIRTFRRRDFFDVSIFHLLAASLLRSSTNNPLASSTQAIAAKIHQSPCLLSTIDRGLKDLLIPLSAHSDGHLDAYIVTFSLWLTNWRPRLLTTVWWKCGRIIGYFIFCREASYASRFCYYEESWSEAVKISDWNRSLWNCHDG